MTDVKEMTKIIESCIGTKFIKKWSDLACKIAIEATATVSMEERDTGRREIDIKRYAKVEKIPGGTMEDSKVLKGGCSRLGRANFKGKKMNLFFCSQFFFPKIKNILHGLKC